MQLSRIGTFSGKVSVEYCTAHTHALEETSRSQPATSTTDDDLLDAMPSAIVFDSASFTQQSPDNAEHEFELFFNCRFK